MNDRADQDDLKLLKLAAKAVGIKALKTPDGILRDCTGFDPMMNIYAAPPWNPITDDGDALRLAVKLWLSVEFFEHDFERVLVSYSLNLGAEDELWHEVFEETFRKDRDAATRRAITRAAAEIGKGLTKD